MERVSVPDASTDRPAFRDGLGERRKTADPAGIGSFEQLCLRRELAAVPSFEFALRERASRLATFRHEQFARVRSIERLSDGESLLCVVSDHVDGVRLSELLHGAEHRRLGLDTGAALCLIRQLVAGVAALHESAREVAHGVIGPERLVVTPGGRLVIVEYVLGASLEQLRYPRERYWSELRVALPSSAGLARLDQRADVMQVGIVALSLILGRLLRDDEYPVRMADVLASASAVSAKGGPEPLPAGLRAWIGRALQLDVRTGFGSAAEARAELDKMLADVGQYTVSPANLDAFLARYHRVTSQPPFAQPHLTSVAEPIAHPAPAAPKMAPKPSVTAAPLKAPATAAPTAPRRTPSPPSATEATPPLGTLMSPPATPRAAMPSPGSAVPTANALTPPLETVMPLLTPARGTPIPVFSPPVAPRVPIATATTTPVRPPSAPLQLQSMAESVSVAVPTPPRGTPIPASVRRPATPTIAKASEPPPPAVAPVAADRDRVEAPNWPRLAAIAGVSVALLLVGAFVGWAYFGPAAIVVTDGTLVITTNPSGAQAIVDGRGRGTTPLTLKLPEGNHKLELRSAGGTRTIRVMVTAGMQVAQFIELPMTLPGAGHLQVRTEPAGARVTVDGVARGMSPLTVSQLSAGEHTVLLESDLGSVKQTVMIEPGVTAQMLAPMAAPEAATVSGWITVSSPLELQVFEGDRLLGTSRADRIVISAGRHDIVLVSEVHGYRATRSVQIAAGKVVAIAAEMPSGTIALNAAPWAEVWIDGARIGETPIASHTLPIGTHEVVFRHPELGEQTHTATVTLKDAALLSVDMLKK